ncbi:MAG: PIN domain-containing protein [Thermodesulfobacteriota bacterium]
MADLLLDTGPFVALLDRSERSHLRCLEFFQGFRGRLFTTEAVLTEVVYLLGPSFQAQQPALELVLQGGAELLPMSQALLERCLGLMAKYADIPMDYADATLVAVAEERQIRDIFTLDLRGFSTYRLSPRKPFRIQPPAF